MKKSCLIFVLFLLSFQLFADDDKLKLAVMDLEDLSGKLSEETLSGASEYFRVIFAQTNRYIIISKDRQKEQISGLRKKYNTDPTYKSCTDKNCQIQLGQALSADLIVKTSVSFFAGSYTLASELIDIEKEATIIAATEDYDGSPQALKTAIKNIVDKIVEAEKKENELTEEEISGKTAKKNKKNSSVNSKDQIACEYARKKDSSSTWKTYLSKYPDGECAAEAKETLDNKACALAKRKSTVESWQQYLKEFPDGRCEFEASEKINTLENKSVAEESEREEFLSFNSTADKKLEGIFSGRWNLGLGVAFNTPNKIGFGTGFDFNFKVFEKPYGGGAENLFVGFGFDFKYWVKTAKEGYDHDKCEDRWCSSSDATNHLINIPIQANIGYEFKINNPTLRYVGLWSSLGMGIDMDAYPGGGDNGAGTYIQLSFTWDITLDMIFKNGMLLNIGVGGNKSKEDTINKEDVSGYWALDHTYLTFGTGVIF
ncbi:hypothetical protein J6W78_06345 [bacterium]|nr:hypothetical protein [bacterium]